MKKFILAIALTGLTTAAVGQVINPNSQMEGTFNYRGIARPSPHVFLQQSPGEITPDHGPPPTVITTCDGKPCQTLGGALQSPVPRAEWPWHLLVFRGDGSVSQIEGGFTEDGCKKAKSMIEADYARYVDKMNSLAQKKCDMGVTYAICDGALGKYVQTIPQPPNNTTRAECVQ